MKMDKTDIMTVIRLLYEVNLAAHVGGAISFGANSSVQGFGY